MWRNVDEKGWRHVEERDGAMLRKWGDAMWRAGVAQGGGNGWRKVEEWGGARMRKGVGPGG